MFAQDGTVAGGASAAPQLVEIQQAPGEDYTNPLRPTGAQFVCGDLTQAGTAISGDADGADDEPGTGDEGTSSVIPVSGIPLDATVEWARLYWTVLTNDDPGAFTGAAIQFDGNGIVGTQIATNDFSPCFPQGNSLAYRADVTALVSSPGNGNYTVSGFPGGNTRLGDHFAEGATLQILWSNESDLRAVSSYEASGVLPVTVSPSQVLDQDLSFSATDGSSGTLYTVLGNGQSSGSEGYRIFDANPPGPVNFVDTLDGSSAGAAAASCSYTDDAASDCFWDDDAEDISAALSPGTSSVLFHFRVGPSGGDCIDFPALAVSVSTDNTFEEYCEAGGSYADAECPPEAEWANHGDYVSCVAHAADEWIAENTVACSTSCIVNPRARSNVGKRGGRP